MGGVDETRFSQEANSHPAVALLTNRFLLFRELVSELPPSLQVEFPFYAYGDYDLFVEVHKYAQPYLVRYALLPASKTDHSSIVQAVIEDPKSDLMFLEDESGGWSVTFLDEVRQITKVETIAMPELVSEPPGNWASTQVAEALEKYLVGFPPVAW